MKYVIKLFNDGRVTVVGVHMGGDNSLNTQQEFTNCHLNVTSKFTHIKENGTTEVTLLTLSSKDVVSTLVEDEQKSGRDLWLEKQRCATH